MVICLLLSAAATLWPLGGFGRRPKPSATERLSVGGDAQDPQSSSVTRPSGGSPRPVILGLVLCVLGLLYVVAGVVGVTAAAAVLGTSGVLVRRAVADRRGRVAMIDIAAGLRMLGRELRAGAEPAVAAANAGAAARGVGAEVLRGLARLTRADDRSSVGSGSAVGSRLTVGSRSGADSRSGGRFPPHGSAADRGMTEVIGPGSVTQLPDDPGAQATARLRSGWLLTRRHGLAFTPLIDALAADLSEQIVAEADRAGQVAGPRMSGYVMSALPILGLTLGVGMGADPLRVLLLTPVGNILLLVGVLLTCAGLLWSARIVRR